MEVKSLLFVGAAMLLSPCQMKAQFYTIMREKEVQQKPLLEHKSARGRLLLCLSGLCESEREKQR
jgi:hypothetical protein